MRAKKERPRPGARKGEPLVFTGAIPVRELMRRYIAWAFVQLGGHRTRTAEQLGIDFKTLAKWLRPPEPPNEGV